MCEGGEGHWCHLQLLGGWMAMHNVQLELLHFEAAAVQLGYGRCAVCELEPYVSLQAEVTSGRLPSIF
jgi:hypothetical protein